MTHTGFRKQSLHTLEKVDTWILKPNTATTV